MTEIDVSNCTYYVEGECDIHQDSCTKVECQYKWYKRIEAENAKLKEELAEANQLKDMYHTYYRAKHDDIKGIIFKQKEKLENIKEICKEAIIFCDDCHYVDSNYICIDCTDGGRASLAKEIIEVLKDE